MSRDEEIRQAAGKVGIRDNKGRYAHGFLMQALREAFTEGAQWADEHLKMAEDLDDCSRDDLLGLIEFYRQALEVQGKTVRQLVIAKVCRWLAHNAHEYLDADNGYVTYKIIEEFEKAMNYESKDKKDGRNS